MQSDLVRYNWEFQKVYVFLYQFKINIFLRVKRLQENSVLTVDFHLTEVGIKNRISF